MTRKVFTGAQIFDGTRLLSRHALVVEGDRITEIVPLAEAPQTDRVALAGGYLVPGFLDLQINGGGGIMVDGQTDLAAIRHICTAHRNLGTAGVLPTLITDTATATATVIAAGVAAAKAKVPGFLGLHLEGPHLDPRRKGAHDPALIRPMEAEDLARICNAAAHLPALMLTVAPASVTLEQISTLAAAGVVVSLGHSDCSYETARAAIAAGARCVTHLFNAMSQIGNREPGLTGAALEGGVMAGLIADGIHVHPTVMRLALAANPRGIYLVSDCMAFAGTDLTEITLGGRKIIRQNKRLTLGDGTLAGADLSLPQAIGIMVQEVGAPIERALAMATSLPATVIGVSNHHGALAAGREANFVHLDASWQTIGVHMADEWL